MSEEQGIEPGGLHFLQSKGIYSTMELIGEYNMEIIEVKCKNCSKEIYIQREQVREKMFCTLGCMDSYKVSPHKTDFT